MGLALSTSWNAFACLDAKRLLFEIENAGFKEIELSFNLREATVRDIARLAPKRGIKVVSLHNFCPIPQGMKREEALPDAYAMSSLNEEERKNAVKYSKRTIDTAERMGAKAVVLHCGRVEITNRTKRLIALFKEGKNKSEEFIKTKKAAIAERKNAPKAFLQNTIKSLEAINRYAQSKNILLGIETRIYYQEIPSFKEIGLILDTFKGSNIRYWHDTGHAQVMQDLGFVRHIEYLKAYAKEMLGVHLHDTFKCQDHLAPSSGNFDFSILKKYLSKDTLKVVEAHKPATLYELKKSKSFLEATFNGRI